MSSFKKIQGYWVNYIKWTSWILPVVFCIFVGSRPPPPPNHDLSVLCPYQQAIPFLFSITMLTGFIYAIVACSCYCCNSKKVLSDGFYAVYGLFLHFFQFLGLFWVYSIISTVSFDPKSPNYCDKSMYVACLFIVSYPLLLVLIVAAIACYLLAND